MTTYDILEVLPRIDPSRLDYSTWLSVGMALKDAGYPVSIWEDWSRRDAARYHPGECEKKWAGFRGAPTPVTAGTIVQLARDQGWEPPHEEGRALDWNDEIGGRDDLVVVQHGWVEGKEVTAPGDDWNPAAQLTKYLETLFEAGENVGYVTTSWFDEAKNRHLPSKGNWDRTAGQLIEALNKCGGDIGSVLGDYNPEVGAWIRFNPLDGSGCKNENVTEYRYALVESDTMEIDQQNAILRELELPIACLVHSGKKSLHAIVRVDAADYAEYRKRVDFLYEVCKKNGMTVDTQNKNPSRLSRMPGVMRAGRKQYLVDTNIGKASWKEWQEWIESVNDDLPEPKCLDEVWSNMPPLKPTLIADVLRQGHKLLLAGPSKAGKSYALIQLCIAIAEGHKWFNWRCAQGRVLYVNLELDEDSCWNRIKDVYGAMGLEGANRRNIDVWNLRGKAIPMDKLAPKLIRRAVKKNYIAIVIDPIYKVITGDENSADQMANFCNQFDKVCCELGCAVIYCHHHSKGQQGQKRSMDRASGSGVFARDPDAMLDMIELEPTEALRKQEGDKAAIETCKQWLSRCVAGWQEQLSQDALCSITQTLLACEKLLTPPAYKALLDAVEAARKAAAGRTAWRIEGTLREFPRFEPVNLWFDYPVHHVDTVGSLKDIDAEGEAPPWQKAVAKRKKGAEADRKDKNIEFEQAVAGANFGDPPTKKQLAEYLNISERSVGDRLKAHGGFIVDKNNGGLVVRKAP